MIVGTGLIGILATAIIIAAVLYGLYMLLPAGIPPNLRSAIFIFIFIILFIWFIKVVLPALGLAV